ncbi:MAG: GIY-YIG nuclease family protein [bacterium]
MSRVYFVYILTNSTRSVLYTGVTNDLVRRLTEHALGTGSDFTRRYHVSTLIYVEMFGSVVDAITREKQIKNYSRARKERLIKEKNLLFADISREIATLRSQ